ncbi:MAG: galactokinase [Oscillospiraceae bacterium]|nr:galactokinase [Oscillospiraceae bacterium]
MKNMNDVLRDIGSQAYDEQLEQIYGAESLTYQRQRYIRAVNEFENEFGTDRNISIFSAPARTEICGNHTDHQLGNVLSASVSMDIICIVSPNNDGVIRVKSKGFPMDEIAVSLTCKRDPNEYSPLGNFVIADLDPYQSEEYKSIALIRGIAARLYLMGIPLKGFDCYTTSDIISGVGLSSSGAFEVLIGSIMNCLLADGRISLQGIAEIGKFAENYYYKKPCGLMDQITSAMGGVLWIDFYDSDMPFITKVDFDLENSGYTLCIVESGAAGGVYEAEYKAIHKEMVSAANFFGKNILSRVDEEEFLTYIDDVRKRCGDRAVLRAWHFFEEDKRAIKCARCLQKKKMPEFLNEINKSGKSSFMYLQNAYTSDSSASQPLSVAFALCDHLLGDRGAFRVHGGGFGGTVQAFVPNDMLDDFKNGIEKMLGEGKCHVLNIRHKGCVEIGGNYV